MKFAGWYLKIAAVGASIGAAMELFMIHTGFYDKVVVLESEKRAWESSPEAQAMREALNPWRKRTTEEIVMSYASCQVIVSSICRPLNEVI